MQSSRRTLLKGMAVASTGAVLRFPTSAQAPSAASGSDQRPITIPVASDLVNMHTGKMVVAFDRRFGTLYSITHASDPLKTNFIGNPENTPGLTGNDTRFTGDVLTTVWKLTDPDWGKIDLTGPSGPSGSWTRQTTGQSSDVRQVVKTTDGLTVKYEKPSASEHGISSFSLLVNYRAASDGSLIWEFDIQNVTNDVLEIGELGLPLMVNDDYEEIAGRKSIQALRSEERTPYLQQHIHEEKVLAHHFISGHSSYVLVQRPAGNGPFLLIHPLADTPFECIYSNQRDSSECEGCSPYWSSDVLAIFSRATKQIRGWETGSMDTLQRCFVPVNIRHFRFGLRLSKTMERFETSLYKAGNLGIRILPSMVVQEDTDVFVDVKCEQDFECNADAEGDQIIVTKRQRTQDRTLMTLAFKGPGQKTLRLTYGDGKWTNLHFYCIPDIEELIKKRSRFIVERQFYQNPSDPFHRYHMFMPYSAEKESIFTDSDEVWEVGGSDEFGFSEPLFLAWKNVYFPSLEEIDTLETYVGDCLFKYIQDPQTFEVRASLYWKQRTPSSPWGHWSKERSEQTWRTYNYPHPANIYHALYLIGRRYGLGTHKKPEEYLRMSYQTCIKWFNTGRWKHIGVMCGSNAINILEDLKREGWEAEYQSLLSEMRKCNEEFVRDPYPYSSELLIDQTAHEQVYFFTRYFNEKGKAQKTLRVIEALRGGDQPVWFRYGNDKRGDMACWYSESLNGIALLKGFEDNGDSEMLLKGYAGLMSVSANLRQDGMGFGWFISSPESFGHKPARTLDNGIGQWGFFKGAKSYVIDDDVFGTIGCGCKVSVEGDKLVVTPKDGLRKRLRFVATAIDVDVLKGELKSVTYDRSAATLSLSLGDSTGLAKTVEFVIDGLPKGLYTVSYGDHVENATIVDVLSIKAPMDSADLVKIEKKQ